MLKKLIILALVLFGAFFFYKKFMASTMEPFFNKHTGNVDFIQQGVKDYKPDSE